MPAKKKPGRAKRAPAKKRAAASPRRANGGDLELLTSNNLHPRNPRVMTPAARSMLFDSLKQFGDLSGIVLNKRTGHLVGGNQRVETFVEGELPVTITERLPEPDRVGTTAYGYITWNGARFTYREVEWDEKTELAANLAANKHGGEWDNEELTSILKELRADESFNVALTGFEVPEIDRLIRQLTVPSTNSEIDENALSNKLNGDGGGSGGGRGDTTLTATCPKCKHEFPIAK